MRSWLGMVALNTLFWIFWLSLTVVFAVGGSVYVTAFALCVRDQRRTLWLLRRTISHYGTASIYCGWPLVRVRYVDHSPQDKPPFIFVANHRSASDAYLMSCLPFECIQVVNIWPFKIPFLGIVAKLAGYLSVREMPVEDFLESGSTLLAQGVSVITFPEGTRARSRAMGPFHGTAFRLALQAGATIVPLAISGSENIPRRGSLLLRPGQIVVHKLPGIGADEFKGLSVFELKTLVHQRLQEHLNRLEAGTP